MSETPRKWMILLHRVQQGPYSQAQIEDLMAKKLVKPTDLALVVAEGKQLTTWQFLWQFPEFERRKKDIPGFGPEQRTQRSPEAIQKEINDRLEREFPAKTSPGSRPTKDPRREEDIAHVSRIGLAFGLAGIFAIVGIVMHFLGSSAPSEKPEASAKPASRSAVAVKAKDGLPGARPVSRQPASVSPLAGAAKAPEAVKKQAPSESTAAGTSGAEVAKTADSRPRPVPAIKVSDAGAGSLSITWDKNDKDEEFAIERREGDGEFQEVATVEKGTSTYTDTGLISGTLYEYKLRVLDGTGASIISKSVTRKAP